MMLLLQPSRMNFFEDLVVLETRIFKIIAFWQSLCTALWVTICVIVLFEYTCDMNHEADAKIKIKLN